MNPQALRVLEQRLSLVGSATPVRRLSAVSLHAGRDVHAKQDDQSSQIYGGTKTRKLEFILQHAMDSSARSLVTLGGWGSHHVTATASHARPLGLEVHAVVAPQPRSALVELNLRRSLAAGAVLHPVGGDLGIVFGLWRLMRRLRREARKPYLVNLGGSSAWGTLGTVRAAFELMEQVRLGQAPAVGPVVVALGSGSTVAGLALGFVLAGAPRPVRAVRVTSRLVVNPFVIQKLLAAAAELLVEPSARRALVRDAARLISIDESQVGQGYGWSTPAGDAAMELAAADGLLLEPTYTAKAMAAVLAEKSDDAPVLYWHTLAGRLPDPPDEIRLPPWL